MTATHEHHFTVPTCTGSLFLLGVGKQELEAGLHYRPGSKAPGSGRSPGARNTDALLARGKGRQQFELPENAAVVSCYEAGRDGFWLHRFFRPSGSRTSSLTPQASKSIDASAGPSPIASMR